jgi:hypothetical protein
MPTMNKFVAGSVLTGSLMFGIACGETSPETPQTAITADDILANGERTIIRPGDSVIVSAVTDGSIRAHFRDQMQMVDHQWEHGLKDENAPKISKLPIRVDANVSLTGKSPDLHNDLACDTLRVDTGNMDSKNIYIGALALSNESDDSPLVSWPLNSEGQPGPYVYACFDDGKEAEDGLVLVINDQLR